MGAGERAEFLAATQHGLRIMALYFSVTTAMKILLKYPHGMYLSFSIPFATHKQALPVLRGGSSCLLQGARKGYFRVIMQCTECWNIWA
jgi:hypothetical protein